MVTAQTTPGIPKINNQGYNAYLRLNNQACGGILCLNALSSFSFPVVGPTSKRGMKALDTCKFINC